MDTPTPARRPAVSTAVPAPSQSFDHLMGEIDAVVPRDSRLVGASGYPVPLYFCVSEAGKTVGLPPVTRRTDEALGICAQSITWRSLRVRWYFIGPARSVESLSRGLERVMRGTQEDAPLGSVTLLSALDRRVEGARPSHINTWLLPERRLAWSLDPAVAALLPALLAGRV